MNDKDRSETCRKRNPSNKWHAAAKDSVYLLLLSMVVFSVTIAHADNSNLSPQDDNPDDHFEGFEGCFVLFDLDNTTYYRINEKRCATRFAPCSTFKIVNSLIGLETGVLKDDTTLFKWDGRKRSRKTLNRDHTLRSAIRYSVFWYYQEIARRVGMDKMRSFIEQLSYGNKDLSGGLTQFWLANTLEISANEQVETLKGLLTYDIPFTKQHIDLVKGMINLGYEGLPTVYGKTGSGFYEDGRHIGWFIGFVKNDTKYHVFAVNISGDNDAHGFTAKRIAFNLLRKHSLLN